MADGTAAALADIEARVKESQEQVVAVQEAMHKSEGLVEQLVAAAEQVSGRDGRDVHPGQSASRDVAELAERLAGLAARLGTDEDGA